MPCRPCLLLLIVTLSTATLADDPPVKAASTFRLDQLTWLAGRWGATERGTETEEHWMAPKGGQMLGMNRAVFASGKSSFEFLRLAESEGNVVYYASPGGKPATPFKLIKVEGETCTFENADNSFPQRIIYRRELDTLHARIEGTINGQERSMSWTWKKLSN